MVTPQDFIHIRKSPYKTLSFILEKKKSENWGEKRGPKMNIQPHPQSLLFNFIFF